MGGEEVRPDHLYSSYPSCGYNGVSPVIWSSPKLRGESQPPLKGERTGPQGDRGFPEPGFEPNLLDSTGILHGLSVEWTWRPCPHSQLCKLPVHIRVSGRPVGKGCLHDSQCCTPYLYLGIWNILWVFFSSFKAVSPLFSSIFVRMNIQQIKGSCVQSHCSISCNPRSPRDPFIEIPLIWSEFLQLRKWRPKRSSNLSSVVLSFISLGWIPL